MLSCPSLNSATLELPRLEDCRCSILQAQPPYRLVGWVPVLVKRSILIGRNRSDLHPSNFAFKEQNQPDYPHDLCGCVRVDRFWHKSLILLKIFLDEPY